MPLSPIPQTLGLWRDPQWAQGMPGVYALVVGASAYPHLAGGSDPAPETHGLEQLVSSATTAAELFDWLCRGFHRQDLPVVWCSLLLSPTEQERKAIDELTQGHYATPTIGELRKAIQRWTGCVPTEPPASQKSRTLFFFSGHGVQSNRDALLLPSDYLDPQFGAPVYENCISASELREWMEESPVAEHLALLDACRNEFSPLASKGATANTVFPVNPPNRPAPKTAATLAATSPNAVAFQMPGRKFTFFGQAVLEGLGGEARAGGDLHIELLELIGYVKPRVNELLKEAASTPLEQTARPSIEGELGLVVTELPSVAATPMSTLESLVTPPPPSVRSARALEATSAAAAVDARFDPALSVRDRISFSALRAAPAEAQRRFGHEYASEIWRRGGARLCSMRDGSEVPFGADVCGVERDDASSIVRVDLCLAPSPHGLLVVFEGGGDVQRERLAVALPTDPEGPVPVRLTLSIARSAPDQRPRIQTLQARLGTPSDGNPHYQYLWSLTRQADLGSLADAVGRADAQRLVDAARDKVRSTTAAMAGVLLLARGGALARIGDWARNLMNWFPDVPDGAVLWAESLRAALVRGESAPFGVAHPLEEMNQALETLRVRGLPFFADSLELTHSLTRYLRRAERSSANPSAARLARLDALDAQLSRAFRIATPSGHFLMLAGLPRPEGFDGGTGALSVDEMLRTLRPSSTP